MWWRSWMAYLVAALLLPLSGAATAQPKSAAATQPASGPTKTQPASGPTSQPGSLPAAGFQEVPDTGKPKSAKGARIERGVRLRPERVLVGLEITPGVAIPFGNYLDFGDAGADNYFLENGAGFAISVSLTLNRLELRYAYASLSTGRVKAELPDEVVNALNIYNQAAGLPAVSKSIDIEAPSNLEMHHLSLGYRITWEITKVFNLVFPVGFGLVIARPPDFGIVNYSLFGFGAFAGIRPEFKIGDLVAIGVDTRFSAYITEPDANLAGAGYAATKKVFDNAIAWLPMLSVAASARIYY
jgi:hypothetical protein